jgi:N-formylglutamate amidohydrolase
MPLSADVVIGDAEGRTASAEAVSDVERALTEAGFTTERNERFTGGWVVRSFAEARHLDAVQLEINQRSYARTDDVDAGRFPPRIKPKAFAATKEKLRTAITQLLGTL